MENSINDIKKIILKHDYQITHTLSIGKKWPKYFPFDQSDISENICQNLSSLFPDGLFLHQAYAIKKFKDGNNICISTSTASGKSLIFYILSIERLIQNPKARILAIYPLKSLGFEQTERWQEFLNKSSLNMKAGRIDGNINMQERLNILKTSNVLIMTPDIIHAWLFRNISDPTVINFLQNLEIVVVDEVHHYSGVFGSNSSFLFRRLNHFLNMLNSKYKYITASATISNPEIHLQNLFGISFLIIDSKYDASPQYPIDIYLLNPLEETDIMTSISNLLREISQSTSKKFITFVDSRKQTEYISTILSRTQKHTNREPNELDDEFIIYDKEQTINNLEILPYRAGYEENDRKEIQKKLTCGDISGVISTSALELGLDIPNLSIAVLVGVPYSSTSFYQRIGRIGRKQKGTVLIINNKTIASKSVFRNPENLLNLPLNESALYLENEYIQYIHAMCLCRQEGEHQKVNDYLGFDKELNFKSQIIWPKGFIELCEKEESGSIPANLQMMKSQCADNPNIIFPLRDIGQQYRIKVNMPGNNDDKGDLSLSQLMREAYPGAVYYYATKPYRVTKVRRKEHLVEVRPEKYIFTKPIILPTQIYPNLDNTRIKQSIRYNDLVLIECDLQVHETIIGFLEKRGNKEKKFSFPLTGEQSLYYKEKYFSNTFFTTGVLLFHPSFDETYAQYNLLSDILYEAFLLTIPFERNDLNFGFGKLKKSKEILCQGQKFICLLDQNYGSLRLSSRLLDEEIFKRVVRKMEDLANSEIQYELTTQSRDAIINIDHCLKVGREEDIFSDQDEIIVSDDEIKIIAPGSIGINQKNSNKEFLVSNFFYHHKYGFVYNGQYKNWDSGDDSILIAYNDLLEIPGETEFALFNPNTNEIKKIVI